MRLVSKVWFIPLVLVMAAANAQDNQCRPADGNLEGMEIGQIRINNSNIFNLNQDDENSTLHSIANKLHIKTTTSTIKQQLLFETGQRYRSELIAETERKLRAKSYLYEAVISVESICDEKLVVVVKTSDNWTLTPSISASRSGGVNRTAYKISESNLLGLGKEIKIKSQSDEERQSSFFRYDDDNLLGSAHSLSFKLANNSDGDEQLLSIGKPFNQLDSRSSYGLDLNNIEQQTQIYQAGKITGITGRRLESLSVAYGWSNGLFDNKVLRYVLGWTASDKRYFNVIDYPDTQLPEEQYLSYPSFSINYFENKFIKRENFNVMGALEDIAVGRQLSLSIGLLSQALGSSHDGLKMATNFTQGIEVSERSIAFIEVANSIEMYTDAADYNSIKLSGEWRYHQDVNHGYYFKGLFQKADNLLDIDQYVIGGDTGLRGYPIRFQTGTSKALISVEKRTYLNWYPLKLIKFGYAVFADIGSAWKKNESPSFIKDVGVGIRMVSTRQSHAKVLHLDFAYPLDDKQDLSGFQIMVKAKSQF